MKHNQVMTSFEVVKRIDFSQIRFKLAHDDHGTKWTSERIERAELLYIAFLSILHAYRNDNITVAPPVLVDEYWHQHILDTRKYFEDCKHIFGEYLHHFPYFGLRGPDDASDLEQAGSTLHALMTIHFGSIPKFHEALREYAPSDCSNCKGSCSSCGPNLSHQDRLNIRSNSETHL